MAVSKNRKYKATYSKAELEKAAKEAYSKREFGLKLFGYYPSVPRLERAFDEMSQNDISSKHWVGPYQSRNTKKRSVNPFGTTKYPSGSHLKTRILQDKLISYMCAECKAPPKWRGKSLTLHLDHIDGNRRNNHLVNLRFLCPNCHQQTETWGQKRGRKLPKEDQVLLQLFAQGKKYKEIALMFDVDPSTVAHRMRKIKVKSSYDENSKAI